MEILVLSLFCLGILLCVFFDWPVLAALGFGLVLFLLYGRKKGFAWKALFGFALQGIKTVRSLLITLMLIGILTALWRAAGTISVIVSYAGRLIHPSVFLLMTFLLNCGVSLLTGTSFGTSATMGVICATVGRTLGISPFWTGGAVLSGAFFGDRCSPVSTSALLISEITGTDIYGNIRRMMKSAAVPFLLTCAAYTLLGLAADGGGEAPDLKALFGQEFSLHWAALLPALAILILAVFHVKVRLSMTVSILAAIPLCLFLQGLGAGELLKTALTGYTAKTPALAGMIGGGGLTSMAKVVGIVCLSSSYSGLFRETGLLDGIRGMVERLGKSSTSFTAVLATAVATTAVACNQTLAILLTEQLSRGMYPQKEALALDMEDSVELIAALVPWSIAGSLPLVTVGAPPFATFAGIYLFAVPLWRLGLSFVQKGRPAADSGKRHHGKRLV